MRHIIAHFRDDLSSQSADWCKNPGLLNKSFDLYWQTKSNGYQGMTQSLNNSYKTVIIYANNTKPNKTKAWSRCLSGQKWIGPILQLLGPAQGVKLVDLSKWLS